MRSARSRQSRFSAATERLLWTQSGHPRPSTPRCLGRRGAAGKLAAVGVAIGVAIADRHALRLAILVSDEAVFSASFVDYLSRA